MYSNSKGHILIPLPSRANQKEKPSFNSFNIEFNYNNLYTYSKERKNAPEVIESPFQNNLSPFTITVPKGDLEKQHTVYAAINIVGKQEKTTGSNKLSKNKITFSANSVSNRIKIINAKGNMLHIYCSNSISTDSIVRINSDSFYYDIRKFNIGIYSPVIVNKNNDFIKNITP